MADRRLIYFDHNATTRVAPEVVAVMLPLLTEQWGNPSSHYQPGREAARHVDAARESVAVLVGAEPREIIFTSGGTESINTAFHVAISSQPERRHLVTTRVEHSASLQCCAALARRGYEVTYLGVDAEGRLDLAELERAIRPDTALVSVMLANNETGVLFPVRAVAEICRRHGVMTHTDATQAPGKILVDAAAWRVDLLSLSAHKLHGPKGTGLLYVRRGTKFTPFVIGGGQEDGRRGGTENVAGVAGFGKAADLACASLAEQATRVRALRDRLEEGILKIPGTRRNGAPQERLPNTTNIAFDGLEAEPILLLLEQAGICASSGSACKSGSLDPSHVLTAMGLDVARARGSVRFSLGLENTEAEVDYVVARLREIAGKLRKSV